MEENNIIGTDSRVGISSACFYPEALETEFEKVAELGFKNIELFINTYSELFDPYISAIQNIKEKYGINIVSVHPFTSFSESFMLFSDYERRYRDMLKFYDTFLCVAEKLGAKIFVIHGAKTPSTVDGETYCKRFAELMKIGEEHKIKVCHENVVNHVSENPLFLKYMSEYIGKEFKIVLDTKQAYRANHSPFEYLEIMKGSIAHIHISDRNSAKDCLPPYEGDFDIDRFIHKAVSDGYKGKFIEEVYHWSYSNPNELKTAAIKIRKSLGEI